MGFVYLTAVVDWASRKVLAAKIAITLEACHAVDVLFEAFNRHCTIGDSHNFPAFQKTSIPQTKN
ncbi:MAG: hypothetical protein FP810_11150 [Desulfocapsa sp.]|nr:hypothetical protein [Desulfocapsa sp.]